MKINYKEVTIITRCPFCGRANEVAVNEADYLDWQDGALVQNTFPYLSADEREMLISGHLLGGHLRGRGRRPRGRGTLRLGP